MIARKLVNCTYLVSSCLLTGLLGTAAAGAFNAPVQPSDQLALQELQANFHGASAAGDYGLMLSLWDEDAVFSGGGNMVFGRTAIANFFAAGPNWSTTANLAPTYKSTYDIRGNTASIRFECVIVRVAGDPLTTSLSSLPPGSQNPAVEIVQHSTASISAVKKRGKWLIETFTGRGGPIVP